MCVILFLMLLLYTHLYLCHSSRSGVQENIDLIRLQREIRDKSHQCAELHSKFSHLSQQHAALKETHDQLLDEIERYHQQLKQEQQRNIALKTEVRNASHHERELFELNERIEDARKENELLKEANERLLNNAFSLDREREFRERERALKVQIAQLEATLKADVGEKGTILDKLDVERTQYDKLNAELRDFQVKYYDMKQKYDDMSDKMSFLYKESSIDFAAIEEALVLVRERQAQQRAGVANGNDDHDDRFEHVVDAEKIKAYKRRLLDTEAELADTVAELDKSRRLLITQVKINEDYKKEVGLIQNKMDESNAEYDTKMLEYAQLLDLRAARIKKLERQLKDVVYGTKQVRVGQLEEATHLHPAAAAAAAGAAVPATKGVGKRRDSFSFVGAPTPDLLDHQLIANLERGQNIFEIHITRVNYYS